MRVSAIACSVFLPVFAAALPGQVPDGWIVVASTKVNPATLPFPGIGGLFLAHPRMAGPPTVVRGLGSDLTGAGISGFAGAGSVEVRASDGALVVGEITRSAQDQCDLHLITLNGDAVVADRTFRLGTGGGVAQTSLLPGGDVVVLVGGSITSGPLAKAILGRVNLVTGAVVPVPVGSGMGPGASNAMIVDRAGRNAYIGLFNTASSGSVWRVSLPAGGRPTLVARTPSGINNLAWSVDGRLIAGAGGPANGFFGDDLLRIDVATGKVEGFNSVFGIHCAIDVETATGNVIGTSNTLSPVRESLVCFEIGKQVRTLSDGPKGGWGLITGIAVRHSPRTFGTANGDTFPWQLSPNPGGLPLVGNSSFSLTVDRSADATASSFVVLSAARLDKALSVLGFRLNVDPAKLLWLQPIGGSQARIGLPIPNVPGLRGSRMYVQTLHSGRRVSSSLGLELVIL